MKSQMASISSQNTLPILPDKTYCQLVRVLLLSSISCVVLQIECEHCLPASVYPCLWCIYYCTLSVVFVFIWVPDGCELPLAGAGCHSLPTVSWSSCCRVSVLGLLGAPVMVFDDRGRTGMDLSQPFSCLYCRLCFSIALWITWWGCLVLEFPLSAESPELLTHKLWAIVWEHSVWNSMSRKVSLQFVNYCHCFSVW